MNLLYKTKFQKLRVKRNEDLVENKLYTNVCRKNAAGAPTVDARKEN